MDSLIPLSGPGGREAGSRRPATRKSHSGLEASTTYSVAASYQGTDSSNQSL
jgi:hypothetical protein